MSVYLGNTNLRFIKQGDVGGGKVYLGNTQVLSSYVTPQPIVPVFLPSYSPYAYYDATNTSLCSDFYWNDAVTGGTDSTRNFNGTYSTKPSYVSGQYFDFNGANDLYLSSSALLDPLNNLSTSDSTTIMLYYPTTSSVVDMLGNAGGPLQSAVIMFNSGSNFQAVGYGIPSLPLGNVVSSLATTSSINNYNFGGMRFDYNIPTRNTIRLDTWITAPTSINSTFFVSGSNISPYDDATPTQQLILGARDSGTTAVSKMRGRIAQIAIYDKVLSDAECIQVMSELKTHQGI
jgi:hypothetical protein